MSEIIGIFSDVGVLIMMCVVAYMFYQIARSLKNTADKEEKFDLYEEMVLMDHANRKGYDIEKEIVKRKYFNKKSFRKRIEEEIYKDFFKEKEE